MSSEQQARGMLDQVTNELLAHGEFSSSGNSVPNARIAAQAVIDIVIAALPVSQAGQPVAWREVEMMRLIHLLRTDEGDSVTLICDNPDFNGQPNCAVICNGYWTEWNDRRFAADTLLDALSMAATEKQMPAPRPVIAVTNGHHWVEAFNLVCCRDCGIVRREDDQNKPCKGVVRVGPRDAAPQSVGVQPVEEWCQPSDRGKPTPRRFMIYFDDPDHGIMVFEDEAEAWAAFEQKNTAWNCYLFGALPRVPGVQPSAREALETIEAQLYEMRSLKGWRMNLIRESLATLKAALANGQPTSGVREALEEIAAFNITPDTGYSVAQAMRRTAEAVLAAAPPARSKMAQRAPNTNPHATWQTVPLPATSEMTAAAELVDAEMRRQGFANAEPEAIYYAMLDAAPSPPVQGSSEDCSGDQQ